MKYNITLSIILLVVVIFAIQVTASSQTQNPENSTELQPDAASSRQSLEQNNALYEEISESLQQELAIIHWPRDLSLNDQGFLLPDVEYVEGECRIEKDVEAGQGETHLSIAQHDAFSDYRFIDFGDLVY